MSKQDLQEQKRLQAAADSVTRQAIKADGEYSVPVDHDVAEFMGITELEDVKGNEHE